MRRSNLIAMENSQRRPISKALNYSLGSDWDSGEGPRLHPMYTWICVKFSLMHLHLASEMREIYQTRQSNSRIRVGIPTCALKLLGGIITSTCFFERIQMQMLCYVTGRNNGILLSLLLHVRSYVKVMKGIVILNCRGAAGHQWLFRYILSRTHWLLGWCALPQFCICIWGGVHWGRNSPLLNSHEGAKAKPKLLHAGDISSPKQRKKRWMGRYWMSSADAGEFASASDFVGDGE